jgi:hypothetical protein
MNTNAHANLFFFDWDDTLFACSYYLQHLKQQPISTLDASVFSKIDKLASDALKQALSNGIVYIITNAEKGWVEKCAKMYMPSVLEILNGGEVKIISAKTKYQYIHYDCPLMWKYLAMLDVLKVVAEGGDNLNIISYGDSSHEWQAVKMTELVYPKCVIKRVKFLEEPTIELLEKQLQIVNNTLKFLVDYVGNVDLQICPELIDAVKELEELKATFDIEEDIVMDSQEVLA